MALKFNERTGEFEEVVDVPKKKGSNLIYL